ncbi:hypothetical protein ACL9RL_18870 [Plantibacter sp. Mn2098]|uniref:hypothetical protein n=1 Tax=Plantibacter sp. Mn2098 TaxID=3395266 RepID=UPI003BBF921C
MKPAPSNRNLGLTPPAVPSVSTKLALRITAAAAALVALGAVGQLIGRAAATWGIADAPTENEVVTSIDPLTATASVVRHTVLETIPAQPAAQWLSFSASALITIVAVSIAAAIALLALRLAQGEPFNRTVLLGLSVSSISLIVGSLGSDALNAAARAVMYAAVASSPVGSTANAPALTLDVNLVPIACGLILGLIVTAFGVGTRLRQDVDGLI